MWGKVEESASELKCEILRFPTLLYFKTKSKIAKPKKKFSWLSMIKMSLRNVGSKASCSPKVLKISLAAGLVLVVILVVSLAFLIHQQSKTSGSDGE